MRTCAVTTLNVFVQAVCGGCVRWHQTTSTPWQRQPSLLTTWALTRWRDAWSLTPGEWVSWVDQTASSTSVVVCDSTGNVVLCLWPQVCGSLEWGRLPAVLLLLCVTALCGCVSDPRCVGLLSGPDCRQYFCCCVWQHCVDVSLTPGVWARPQTELLLLLCVTALSMLFCVSDHRCVDQTMSSTASVVLCDNTINVVLSLTPGVWVRLPAVLLLLCVTALCGCVSDPRCVGLLSGSDCQ